MLFVINFLPQRGYGHSCDRVTVLCLFLILVDSFCSFS